MRYWIVAATIVLVLATTKGSDTATIVGLKVNADGLFPASAVILAMINVAYCLSHLQFIRALRIFHEVLESVDAVNLKIGRHSTLADAAHCLYPSSFNRVYPMERLLPRKVQPWVSLVVKPYTDVVFHSLPIVGCIYASFHVSIAQSTLNAWVVVLLLISFSIVGWSVICSILLIVESLRWDFAGPGSQKKSGQRASGGRR